MRVIITGGSGLIGRALTAHLPKDNYEVVILSRSPEQVSGLPENAKVVQWDGKRLPHMRKKWVSVESLSALVSYFQKRAVLYHE
jgi:uncharacterized protein YbjT (DUF2867 family)